MATGDMLQRCMLIGYRSGFFTDADLSIALQMATTDAADILGLRHYGLAPGDEATFVIVEAENAAATVAAPPAQRRLVQRGVLVPMPSSRLSDLATSEVSQLFKGHR